MKGSRALALSASVRGRMCAPVRPGLPSGLPRLGGLALALLALSAAPACKRRSTLVPATEYVQPLRLEFHPPVGRDVVEDITVRTRPGPEASSDAPPTDELTLRTVSRFVPERQAWVLTQRTTALQLRHQGADVQSPLAPLLLRVPLRVQLARDGAFVRVLEAEGLESALAEAGLEPQVQAQAQALLGAEAQQQRVQREWTARYGGVYGRNLQLGQRLYALDAVAVGGRERGYVLERTLSGTLLTDFGEALVFQLRCLGQPPPGAPPELQAQLAASDAPALEPSVSCEGEQVLARGTFVPVRSRLSVHVQEPGADGGAPQAWTWSRSSAAQRLEP